MGQEAPSVWQSPATIPILSMDGSGILWEVSVQRNCRMVSSDRREGHLQGSGAKLPVIIISR